MAASTTTIDCEEADMVSSEGEDRTRTSGGAVPPAPAPEVSDSDLPESIVKELDVMSASVASSQSEIAKFN
jgi:hypothetical protein